MLNDVEIRVLACLVEKQVTTPEYYPLTLNSLVHACNQKSNRDPVVSYNEPQVEKVLRGLQEQGLTTTEYLGAGNRVLKYGNSFADNLKLDRSETAILCELMLRGPQTAGELHSRAERLFPFESLDDIVRVIQRLSDRNPPLVASLPRQPGKKEIRFCHLLSGEPVQAPQSTESVQPGRLETLEQTCKQLEERIAVLENRLDELISTKSPASPTDSSLSS
jgi:uncharacterized protein YceH (UPF0502 family)